MIYKNDSHDAILAMEYARTGGYGEDKYDRIGTSFSCPCCGAYEPDVFYMNDDDECIGCSECVYASERPYD